MARITDYSTYSSMGALRRASREAEQGQTRLSTDLRVSTAADDPAYWSIATTMRSDNAAISTVQDALGLSSAQVDTAYAGIEQARSLVSQIRDRLVMARGSGADRSALNNEIRQLKAEISDVARSASFAGENWLHNTDANGPGTRNLVTGFARTDANSVEVQAMPFDATATTILDEADAERGLLSRTTDVAQSNGTARYSLIAVNGAAQQGREIAVDAQTSDADLDGMINATSQMMEQLTDAGSTLGSLSTNLSQQNSFLNRLEDSISRGVSRLVDADMNEESTLLRAAHIRQQLSIQALAISNSNAANVLQLFR